MATIGKHAKMQLARPDGNAETIIDGFVDCISVETYNNPMPTITIHATFTNEPQKPSRIQSLWLKISRKIDKWLDITILDRW